MKTHFNEIKNGGVCTPIGFSSAGISADIKGKKSTKKDLGLLMSESPCVVAATFTENKVKAAPVIVCKNLILENNEFKGIIVNSGNANACTGKQGIENTLNIIKHYENKLNLSPHSLLMASTGVIGNQLPVSKFIDKSDELIANIEDYHENFNEAIMTTDSFAKSIAVLVETKNGAYVIGGAAKGAGMISPSMATMLAFITTDALIDKNTLSKTLDCAVKNSFNKITVDGDMSTNDSVYVFANGLSGIAISSAEDIKKFEEALTFVCLSLAKMIVKDGEGATKLVEIEIKNATTEEDAKKCAFKIANSPLVKTMFFGADPNWGRLLASVGASLIEIDPDNIDIYFNELHYVSKSTIIDVNLENKAHEIMKNSEYKITIDLNVGKKSFSVYTCDLTYEYVKINTDYRT
ncbi:bifunctional glutamate N-acetyltransferase/amino-acid acetyltransferase ArgJ [Deferribacteraceae bacterium V6Fe1]|nr:bifunctional glutamate N-acetyltransferase/amino-acid acetyltransferase ArgJ [Deferribacteraceae bacterium V6Fe1]